MFLIIISCTMRKCTNFFYYLQDYFVYKVCNMSTKTGQSGNRKKPQKHQNSTVWNPVKHRSDPKAKLVQSLTVINCCQHCTGVIEWKIK